MKKNTSGNTIGTNYFLKSFSEDASSGIFIKDLKNYLADNEIDVRLWGKNQTLQLLIRELPI